MFGMLCSVVLIYWRVVKSLEIFVGHEWVKEEGEQELFDIESSFRGPCGSCELWGR